MDQAKKVRPGTLLLSAAIGLTGGFLLAIPLSQSLTQDTDAPPLLPVSNPFSAWSVFDSRDILVLGVDEGGGNTDAIFTLRVEGAEPPSRRSPETVTSIPTDLGRSKPTRSTPMEV